MNEWPWLAASISGGMALSAFYFGGLWWTLRLMPFVRRPALLILGSFLTRIAVAGGGFFLLMNGSAIRLLGSLLGFLLVRQLLINQIRSMQPKLSAEDHLG